MADVLLAESAADELADLQPDIRDRIKGKLRDAAENPDRHLKSLSGRDTYRLRAGDYRAEVDWDRDGTSGSHNRLP
jgi:mRNA-degrading endonuclease RelE of RelBE toxin-antitoxin system